MPFSFSHFKRFFLTFMAAGSLALTACSTNPATGQRQFTALMSPQQEAQVGAEEHAGIMQTYGTVSDASLSSYVKQIGNEVAAHTERDDVNYQFFVLDDAMVNAFALPGGYVYVTRGLLAQANSEAELAGVLGHEVGHITGRHSAERYSRGVMTSLGAMVLSTALDSPAASQALGLGSDLFLKSYSRGQEHEADMLGIRYLARSGYHPSGMAAFLTALEANTELQGRVAGSDGGRMPGWLSTHPLTADRIQQTIAEARQYDQGGTINRGEYLDMIDGMVYGDSARQGLVRDNVFYHPELDFTFAAPPGFSLMNQPTQVVATDPDSGAVIIFDTASAQQTGDAMTYLSQIWLRNEQAGNAERITINGMDAATASFPGQVSGRNVTIRLVAVEWKPDVFYRFQMAIPQGAPAELVEELKRTTYSLRRMTAAEKSDIRPYRIRIVTAQAGDSVASLARRMPFTTYQEERFRALNAMMPGDHITAGRQYKIVSER